MMPLPMTRVRWEENAFVREVMKSTRTAEDVVRDNVDFLILRCYSPDQERGYRRAPTSWLTELGLSPLSDEPINWGALSCTEVKQYTDGGWEVFIEEAATECPHLAAYIADWLTKWGWAPVRVVTEW